MPEPRFLKLDDVCDELNISASQAYALVRSGDLPAIQVGGRGQWRIERSKLEEYIARMYEQAAKNLEKLPAPDDLEGTLEVKGNDARGRGKSHPE
jgi:excisionase family DNA binding protein